MFIYRKKTTKYIVRKKSIVQSHLLNKWVLIEVLNVEEWHEIEDGSRFQELRKKRIFRRKVIVLIFLRCKTMDALDLRPCSHYSISTRTYNLRKKKSWHPSVLLQYYSRFQKFGVESHQWTSKQQIRHSL